MFQFGKLKNHLIQQRFCYLIMIALFIGGFFIGCFYANLSGEEGFKTALSSAEQFIHTAKKSELDYGLLFSEEISPYALILLSSLCLFGLPVMVFFVFKVGFSSGFFLTFLVKGFSLKGFFLGGIFLGVQLLFLLPALLVIGCGGYRMNLFLLSSVTHRLSPKRSLRNELLLLTVTFLFGAFWVLLGVSVKYLLLPPLCNYLFL